MNAINIPQREKTRQKKSNSSWVSSCHRVFLIRSDTGRPVASRCTAAKDGSAVTLRHKGGRALSLCEKESHLLLSFFGAVVHRCPRWASIRTAFTPLTATKAIPQPMAGPRIATSGTRFSSSTLDNGTERPNAAAFT